MYFTAAHCSGFYDQKSSSFKGANSDYSPSIVWSGFYPDLEKIVDDIINSVDILNNLSESKIGCKLFKNGMDGGQVAHAKTSLQRIT